MAVRSPDERLDRLEQIVQIIAEDHIAHRDDIDAARQLITDLGTDTHRKFEQVAAQFRDTTAQLDKLTRDTDARIDKLTRETNARMEKSAHYFDERVDRLVLSIGQLIRRQDESRQ